jgi:biopolymer transport protein ExbB
VKPKEPVKITMKLQIPLILLLLGAPLAAQKGAEKTAPPADAAVEEGETVFSLILKGGWLMIPIGLCSIVVLTVGIERAISLRRRRTSPPGLLNALFDELPVGDLRKDIRKRTAGRLEGTQSMLGTILAAAVLRIHRGFHLTEAFLSEAASKQVHLLKRRLRPFAVVASLAPLLGLLGTVYGMITCFENAASADAASRAESLARGIYAALVTTATGLTVAIPSYVLYHYFVGRVDRIVDEIEESINTFLEHYFAERKPPKAASPEAPASLSSKV